MLGAYGASSIASAVSSVKTAARGHPRTCVVTPWISETKIVSSARSTIRVARLLQSRVGSAALATAAAATPGASVHSSIGLLLWGGSQSIAQRIKVQGPTSAIENYSRSITSCAVTTAPPLV